MTAPSSLVFELASPRRPTLADVGGATIEDDTEYPPDKTRMPYADQVNQWARLLASMGGMMPICTLWIRFISGAPTLYSVQFASSLLVSGSLSITDEGAGITRLEWSATTFPAPLGEPEAFLTYTTDASNPALIAMAAPIAQSITNGCRVRTYNHSAGVLADCNFGLKIY